MRSPLGQPIRRREDAALVTGRGRFVEDLNIPGTLYLSFARGPHAKARITRIDTAAARRFTGENWIARALETFGIEVLVVDLKDEIRDSLRKAQHRQYR